MKRELDQVQKTICCPPQIRDSESRLPGAGESVEWGVTANWCRVSLCGNENILEFDEL